MQNEKRFRFVIVGEFWRRDLELGTGNWALVTRKEI
jgi:hypothetical protein